MQPEEAGDRNRVGWVRPRAVATAVGAVLVFVALAIASPHVVAWVEGVSGRQAASPAVQAYFPDPLAVNRGIHVGLPVTFVVVTTHRSDVRWVADSSARPYRAGAVEVAAGRPVVVVFPTRSAEPHAWLTIRVSGASVPLRVWLR